MLNYLDTHWAFSPSLPISFRLVGDQTQKAENPMTRGPSGTMTKAGLLPPISLFLILPASVSRILVSSGQDAITLYDGL